MDGESHLHTVDVSHPSVGEAAVQPNLLISDQKFDHTYVFFCGYT
ncbi:Unknown protein sequence [Pseudomonas syringae pv. maculicola]|nr:Unknown protein sequence [Pseudomonas syringae pv. maculicola]